MTQKRIPGPSLPRLLWMLLRAGGDRFEVIRRLVRRYGDLVRFRVGARTFLVCARPEAVREVLIRQQRNFDKGPFYERLAKVIGNGLGSARGEEHRRQRQQVQHLFTHRRMEEHGAEIVALARHTSEQWRAGATLDVAAAMKRLSLLNLARSLFHVDASSDAEEILAAIDALAAEIGNVHRIALPLASLLERLPLRGKRGWRAARERLDAVIAVWIRERRAAAEPRPDDVLTAITADLDRHESAPGAAHRAALDRIVSLLFAGIETTASGLASVWFLLSRHPAVERRLHEELDAVLAGRPPTIEDAPRLVVLAQIVRETLRLHPPVASISRTSRCPVTLDGAEVAAGWSVGLSPWQLHRDERYFPDAEAFTPERWEAARGGAREDAYFPFALGGRRCIGEHFALIEMTLTIAAIAQRWRLVVPDDVDLQLKVSTTVRLRSGLPARALPRL
jgi:pentalenene oxygenase